MPSLVNLSSLIDDAKCYELVRQHRWPDGVRCPRCASASVTRHGRDRTLPRRTIPIQRSTRLPFEEADPRPGRDDTQPYRQRYRCAGCSTRFDDLTGTVLAGHHQPLRVWVLCLYFMGLNLSNRQIAKELDLSQADVQPMAEQLRTGLVARIPPVRLEGEVEIDEVYVVAGHKGNPTAVAKRGAAGDDAG